MNDQLNWFEPEQDRAGYTSLKPIRSIHWPTLHGFFTRKQAEDFAASLGITKNCVSKRFGRFEYAWVVCDPHGRILMR